MPTDQKPAISFCTTLLSRRDDPIHDFRVPHCHAFLKRFQELQGNERAELIIALWPCDDMVLEGYNFELRTTPMEGYFNVNAGHNASSKEAKADILFFCDTDLVLPLDAIDVLLSKVKQGRCYFPIWESETENRSKVIWRLHSYGNAAFHRRDFEQLSGLSEEQAVSWGGDIDIFQRARKVPKLKVLREKWKGLWHQWHPKPARNFYNKLDDRAKY